MKISRGKQISSDGWAGISYDLIPECEGSQPIHFEFSVEEAYSDWLSGRMEAPVMAALFPAMALNETIRTDEPLSAKFHYMLRQVMKYFHLWYPSTLSMVDIECGGVDTASTKGTATCACFSGGVDSFYTLQHHLPAEEPVASYRMTHGLYIHGIDMNLSEVAFYNTMAEQYERVLADQGIKLVRCRSNFREFSYPYANWMTTHGAALIMAAHFLSGGIKTFIIPSTNRFSLINPPIGSNPITDPQPGSETLDIIHHGCEASRIEKIMSIADWPCVYDNLRVCFQEPGQGMNCGACKKCQKVMLPLWIMGKLDRFSCFPANFDPANVSFDCFAGFDVDRYAPEKSYGEELIEIANEYNPSCIRQLPISASKNRSGLLRRLITAVRRS